MTAYTHKHDRFLLKTNSLFQLSVILKTKRNSYNLRAHDDSRRFNQATVHNLKYPNDDQIWIVGGVEYEFQIFSDETRFTYMNEGKVSTMYNLRYVVCSYSLPNYLSVS